MYRLAVRKLSKLRGKEQEEKRIVVSLYSGIKWLKAIRGIGGICFTELFTSYRHIDYKKNYAAFATGSHSRSSNMSLRASSLPFSSILCSGIIFPECTIAISRPAS